LNEKKEDPVKSLRNRLLAIVALGVATICANASPAAAQGMAFQGRFTLPTEVRWQSTVLPAGDYTFSMKSAASPSQIQLNGPKGAFILGLDKDNAPISDRSVLILEHRAGGSIVRELYLAQIGVRIHYYVPKATSEEQLAQGPVSTEEVLIAAAR
jgi:hypothetical protein